MMNAIELMNMPSMFKGEITVGEYGGRMLLLDRDGLPILHESSVGDAEFKRRLEFIAAALNSYKHLVSEITSMMCQLESNKPFCDCTLGGPFSARLAATVANLNNIRKGKAYEPVHVG